MSDEFAREAKAWRDERDKKDPLNRHPKPGPPPERCEHCDPGPCRFPTLCGAFEDANRFWAKLPPNHPLRRRR